MNRLQRGLGLIAANLAMSRDNFLKHQPAQILDALGSKGYVERKGDHYTPTEAGQRFLNDRDARDS